MKEKDWKEFRNVVYHSNISPELTSKIIVALDDYYKILQEKDIDTVQGARNYLKDNEVDVDSYVKKGLSEIDRLLGK